MAPLQLEKKPVRHPDCCLSLSTILLETLTSILMRNDDREQRLVLSIGSGSGLLESLLIEQWSTLEGWPLFVEGVEVQQAGLTTLNKYLSEQHYSFVKGTWDLSPRASEASALIFVYPRNPGLISQYLAECRRPDTTALGLRTVVWLGPKCDWAVFRGCFENLDGWSLRVVADENSGLLEYEMLAVLERQAFAVS